MVTNLEALTARKPPVRSTSRCSWSSARRGSGRNHRFRVRHLQRRPGPRERRLRHRREKDPRHRRHENVGDLRRRRVISPTKCDQERAWRRRRRSRTCRRPSRACPRRPRPRGEARGTDFGIQPAGGAGQERQGLHVQGADRTDAVPRRGHQVAQLRVGGFRCAAQAARKSKIIEDGGRFRLKSTCPRHSATGRKSHSAAGVTFRPVVLTYTALLPAGRPSPTKR